MSESVLSNIFSIDGVNLRLNVVKLEREFSVTDTENSGRLKNYDMYREIAGTFYNYTMEIEPITQYREDYDTFYQMISAPETKHRLVVPYAQKTLEFEAYVTKGKDSLRRRGGKNLWHGLSVYFVAMSPQRRP